MPQLIPNFQDRAKHLPSLEFFPMYTFLLLSKFVILTCTTRELVYIVSFSSQDFKKIFKYTEELIEFYSGHPYTPPRFFHYRFYSTWSLMHLPIPPAINPN